MSDWILSVGGTHFTNRETNETISASLLVIQLENKYELLVIQHNKAYNHLSMIDGYGALEINELTERAKNLIQVLLEKLKESHGG
ncbi:hypothetical protein LCGC14_0869400 [marine sediment metagenome]|uniref:Uncharacterized protein n=1 Tax=marine sediment metagenome TaxID=412755 RepID=A0A0F9P9X1_9ZZZZ